MPQASLSEASSVQRSAQPAQPMYQFTVTEHEVDLRLDLYIKGRLDRYSRTFIQQLITRGGVTCSDVVVTTSSRPVRMGDVVSITLPVYDRASMFDKKAVDALGVTVLYRHEDFFVINKPAGLLVHPSLSDMDSITLVDWILTYVVDAQVVTIEGRPGIVHRLDKDTSGVMVVARTAVGQARLSDMFKDRLMHKTYYAVVTGHPERSFTVDFPIGRDSQARHKMSHRTGGRDACTHFEVMNYFTDTTLVKARPVTGRTHQIRVHAAAVGHPLVGDALYGSPSPDFKRHALHAYQLSFTYEGIEYSFTAELPDDLKRLVTDSQPYHE